MLAIIFNYGPGNYVENPEDVSADVAEAHAYVKRCLTEKHENGYTQPEGYWLLNTENHLTGYYSVTVKPVEFIVTQTS